MHKEMQRQRHKGTYIGRGSQMHKWTSTLACTDVQTQTYPKSHTLLQQGP